jgi:hypothetical protein
VIHYIKTIREQWIKIKSSIFLKGAWHTLVWSLINEVAAKESNILSKILLLYHSIKHNYIPPAILASSLGGEQKNFF